MLAQNIKQQFAGLDRKLVRATVYSKFDEFFSHLQLLAASYWLLALGSWLNASRSSKNYTAHFVGSACSIFHHPQLALWARRISPASLAFESSDHPITRFPQ